ncbi:MAG TPA: hypothetical protein VFA65_22235 [Bryobacteraceae bacterium]|nr:hypothetical protein [Bryobacteraceae bacterium]
MPSYEILNSVPPETTRRIRRIVLKFHPDASYKVAIDPLTANGVTVTRYEDHGEGYGIVWLEQDLRARTSA